MDKPEPETAVWRDILTPRYVTPLALVCLSVWLHAADSLLVATMMPAMVAEIGGANLISWTVALYEIGSIVAAAASGLLAVRHGLRPPMIVAALVFALGCIISAIAPSMWIVLVGRLMQGLGGGGLVALAFVAVGLLFPKRLTGRAMAAISTLWGLSAFMGPLIGGLFVEYGSWRGGFWMFGVKALVLTGWILVKGRVAVVTPVTAGPGSRSTETFPVLRLACLAGGVILIAWSGLERDWVRTLVFMSFGFASLGLFLRLDASSRNNRLLPKTAISLRDPVGSGLTMLLCFTIATIAISVYGPLLLTTLHGASALVGGYVIACSSIGWSVMAIAVAGLGERHARKMIALGMILLTVSIPGFLYSVPNGPVWLVAAFALLEGAGFGMAWVFILGRVTSLAGPGETERVAAAMPTIQRLGYAIGAAYVGVVANVAGIENLGDRDAILSAARAIFIAGLPFAVLGLVATWRFVRAAPPRPSPEQEITT